MRHFPQRITALDVGIVSVMIFMLNLVFTCVNHVIHLMDMLLDIMI